MSVSDAAAWAEVSERDIRKMVASHEIRSFRIGRSIRLKEGDIAEAFGLELPGPRTLEIARFEAEKERRKVAEHRPHWVYRLLGHDDELLYVGISNQGMHRLAQHAAEKDWWPRVFTVRIEHFSDRDSALAREAELIHREQPPFNLAIPARQTA